LKENQKRKKTLRCFLGGKRTFNSMLGFCEKVLGSKVARRGQMGKCLLGNAQFA